MYDECMKTVLSVYSIEMARHEVGTGINQHTRFAGSVCNLNLKLIILNVVVKTTERLFVCTHL